MRIFINLIIAVSLIFVNACVSLPEEAVERKKVRAVVNKYLDFVTCPPQPTKKDAEKKRSYGSC